jgi:hypothetical protein
MFTCPSAIFGAGIVDSPSLVGVGNTGITNSSTALNPTYPSGIVAGDLLVLIIERLNSISSGVTGWTLHSTEAPGRIVNIYTKIASGSETGTHAIVLSGNDNANAVIFAARKAVGATGIAIESKQHTVDAEVTQPNGIYVIPSITTVAPCLLVGIAINSIASSSPQGYTISSNPHGYSAIGNNAVARLRMYLAAKANVGPGQTRTVSLTADVFGVESHRHRIHLAIKST